MSFKTFLQETASGGSTGAGSIAANPSGDSRGDKHRATGEWVETRKKEQSEEKHYADMRERIARAKEAKKKQKRSFKDFVMRRRVNEDFDMNDIVSRLKAADTETADADSGVVSYGIEDDKGNIMRVTVRSDQAKEFEETIARQLADAKSNVNSGIDVKGNSLAEILYNLRDQFEIVTVEFPKIPTDVVYNADQASKAPEGVGMADDTDSFGAGMDDVGGDPSGMGMDDGSMGGADAGMGGPQADGTQMNASDIGGDAGMDDSQGGMGGQPDDFSDENMNQGLPSDETTDVDGMEDFGTEDSAAQDEGSILTQIVAMLKAQAAAQEAQANAAAEESRAKQAEWSAIAADKEVRRQEEIARVEAQVQAEKKKEKDAKKYADIARYNVSKANGMGGHQFESKGSFLVAAAQILKEDQFDNVQTLQKQKLQLQDKYKILPTDDQITQNYKKQKLKVEMDELDARIKSVQLDTEYQNAEANANKKVPQQGQQPQQQQPNNPANQQQPAQQQPNQQGPQVPGAQQ